MKCKLLFALLTLASLNVVYAQEKTEQEVINELGYSVGVAQTQGLKEYLVNSLDVDLDYFSSFVKGLKEGVAQARNSEKKAYYAGIQVGSQIVNQMLPGINKELLGESAKKSIPVDEFMKGFLYGLDASEEEVTKEANKVQTITQQYKFERAERRYSYNRTAGEKFLEQNQKKPGVRVLPSGLQYKVIKLGIGRVPKETDLVKVHYYGKTIDGITFDSSYERGEPAKIKANQVIKGWTEALVNMPVGSIWEVYIPQDLAYGVNEQGEIKPFSALVFKIELISIEKDN